MNKNEKNNSNKNKSVIVITLILSIILILIVICGIAYAKYLSTANGTATAEVADMICIMEVKSSSEDNNGDVISPADKTIVNPYCIVTVKDFTGENQSNPDTITETDVSYIISVTPKKDQDGIDTFTLPEYNWYEITSPSATTGTKVATSTALNSATTSKGSFKSKVAETRYYKIVFLNSGEQDITRYVDFELKAVQDRPVEVNN